MKAKKFLEAVGELDNKYIEEALNCKNTMRMKKNKWLRWGVIAACVTLSCLVGAFLLRVVKSTETKDSFKEMLSVLTVKEDEAIRGMWLTTIVPMGEYNAVYERITLRDRDTLSVQEGLSANVGEQVSGTEIWYYVLGRTDKQYLIEYNKGEYFLWKFVCFESDEYSYRDVLELVYQIDSGKKISKIEVRPAKFNNAHSGKEIQEAIGNYTVKNRKEIDKIYNILASMTCYGDSHWGKIRYWGSDEEGIEGMWLGRYLTIVTDEGNEIDGLKYTGVSDMFYEFSGIAYNRLSEEDAESVREILHIETKKD